MFAGVIVVLSFVLTGFEWPGYLLHVSLMMLCIACSQAAAFLLFALVEHPFMLLTKLVTSGYFLCITQFINCSKQPYYH